MKAETRWGWTALAIACWILSGSLYAGEPRFELSIDAPGSLTGAAGSEIEYAATAKLTTLGLSESDNGAQGWSLSLSAEGGEIRAATTAGTKVEELYDEGFLDIQLTSGGEGACAGKKGVVCAVVLSLTKSVTLPSTGTVDILKLTVKAVAPEPGTTPAGDPICLPLESKVYFVDGCQGLGQPVDNKVTYGGYSYRPTLGQAVTSICPTFTRPITLRVGVVEPEGSAGPKAGSIVEWTVPVIVGSAEVPIVAGVYIVSNLEGSERGPQGWSFSVKTDPCFGLSSATIEGTEVPNYYSNGFEKTEVVDPTKPDNAGQEGAVTAVVLSLQEPRYLPPVSTVLVLRLEGTMNASTVAGPGDRTAPPCKVVPVAPGETGLRGSGQPVKTTVTVVGVSRAPDVLGAGIVLEGAAEARFIRGNPNDDLKVNLADPIWIVNELFHQGPPTACQDAADANDDGMIDSSDAVYLISYLFGYSAGGGSFVPGPEPLPPFPGCGTDPTEDELVCPVGSAKSCY